MVMSPKMEQHVPKSMSVRDNDSMKVRFAEPDSERHSRIPHSQRALRKVNMADLEQGRSYSQSTK